MRTPTDWLDVKAKLEIPRGLIYTNTPPPHPTHTHTHPTRQPPPLNALTEKFTPGMPKMPKPHEQPLCAYLMRNDADIKSHPRPWPKWYMQQKIFKSNEKIWVIIWTPTADGQMDRRTDRRMGWIQYIPPQLCCEGYKDTPTDCYHECISVTDLSMSVFIIW